MHLHPAILFISTAVIASVCFAQDKNAPTLGGLVSKNIEAKGGAASLQGMTQVEAYDGKDGWKVSPFFGRAFGSLG